MSETYILEAVGYYLRNTHMRVGSNFIMIVYDGVCDIHIANSR